MNWLFVGMIAVTVVVTYLAWIRPLLRTRPGLATFYAEEENWFAAARAKLAGLKQKITTVLVVAAGILVSLYDQVAPYLYGADFGQVTKDIPSWAWPLIMMGLTLLLSYFRRLGDRGE